MPINRKSNNKLVEKFGDYAHLYANLTEIEVEDEEGVVVQYEGDLAVMATTLDILTLEDYREALITFAPAYSTLDAALSYLERTDYMVIKCVELGLSIKDEYPEPHALREVARSIVRLES